MRAVAEVLVGRDEFRNGVNVNGPPQPSALNIYIISLPAHRHRAVRKRFPSFVGTIAYVGQPNLVLVDETYLESVGERLGFLGFSGNPHIRVATNAQGLRRLLLWVLGHELGHLKAGGKPRHFFPSALESLAGYTRVGYRQEVVADEAFALRLSDSVRNGRLPQEELTAFGIDLAALADVELLRTMGVSRKQGPMILFFDPEESVPIGTGSHPEFFLRAVRILARLELPTESPLESVRREMRRFEARLLPVAARSGRLVVDGEPAGAQVFIRREETTLAEYRIPAELWLAPGAYTVEVQRDGYRAMTYTVHVAEERLTHHVVRLKPSAENDPFGFRRRRRAETNVVNGRSYARSESSPDAALWEIVQARAMDPAWSLPVMLEAELRLAQGDTQEARALYEMALKVASAERPWMRGSPYQIWEFEQALQNSTASAGNGIEAAQANFEVAERAWIVDELELADAHLSYAAAHQALQARVLDLRALIAFDRHDLWRAEHAATEGVKLGSRVSRLTLARIYDSTDRPREAEQELLGAIRDHPRDPDALRALAEHYVKRSRPADALAAYLRAAEIDPDTRNPWCEIGSLNRQLGDSSAAERAFRRPGRPIPESCTIGLAELYAAAGQQQAAIALCRDRPTTSDDAGLAALAECEGELMASAGDLHAAARAFGEAVWLRPFSTKYRRKLAHAMGVLGQTEAAGIHSWLAGRLQDLPAR